MIFAFIVVENNRCKVNNNYIFKKIGEGLL